MSLCSSIYEGLDNIVRKKKVRRKVVDIVVTVQYVEEKSVKSSISIWVHPKEMSKPTPVLQIHPHTYQLDLAIAFDPACSY